MYPLIRIASLASVTCQKPTVLYCIFYPVLPLFDLLPIHNFPRDIQVRTGLLYACKPPAPTTNLPVDHILAMPRQQVHEQLGGTNHYP